MSVLHLLWVLSSSFSVDYLIQDTHCMMSVLLQSSHLSYLVLCSLLIMQEQLQRTCLAACCVCQVQDLCYLTPAQDQPYQKPPVKLGVWRYCQVIQVRILQLTFNLVFNMNWKVLFHKYFWISTSLETITLRGNITRPKTIQAISKGR